VPYCTYCQTRELEPCEERCYLVAKRQVPYFLSSMPTYEGRYIDMEMSTAVMYENEEENRQEVLLVLKDLTRKKKEEEARISKLILQKTLQAKENEHKRLAQELHDGIGQSLYSISVGIQAIKAHLEREDRFQDYLQELVQVIDGVIQDVKLYSTQLRPHSLDQLGLVPSVTNLLATFRKTHPETVFAFEAGANLRSELSGMVVLNLFRVIQEALHNAVKYAGASCITVSLREEDNVLCLSVEDDGIGFEVAAAGEGLGLKHMEERVHQIGGEWQALSKPGDGCRIIVRVPLGEEVRDDQSDAGG